MATHETVTDVYGPGTFTDVDFTPVPQDARRVLEYFAKKTPGFNSDPAFLDNVKFTGGDLPILPGPIKAQVLSAVCQGMIGLAAKEVSALKGIETGSIHVDTDLVGLYPATVGLVEIDGMDATEIQKSGLLQRVGLDVDKGVISKNPMRFRSWAIFPTREENVNFQILSSLDPPGFLKVFGLEADDPSVKTNEEAYEKIKSVTTKYSARELEHICIEHGFCGQTCLSPQAWRETMMGKSLAKHPMINYKQVRGTESIPPAPLPKTSDKRPLAGIKVVELSRVIAGPAVGTALAALGADVIKVQSPHLPDLQFLSITLMAGKRVVQLDLTKASDRDQLLSILEDADVVVQAFRMKSLERKGLGLDDMVELAKKRNKGMVYVDINCYGPDGYYTERPGYQQIADCASGCSYVNGKAYGLDEGTSVLPSLPIADMLTGAVGTLVTLLAIRDRTKQGGSYHSHVALVSLDTAQLEQEVGLYPPQIVSQVQSKFNFAPMRPQHMVTDLLNIIIAGWRGNEEKVSEREEYYVEFETQFGKKHKILAPAWKFEGGEDVSPRWDWGPVPNGGV
ncbi:hypothetical protein M409DRAFT_51311 [Zasmidium cellare ATCC 36951]|uniref:Uncharacterized protein n=1 Tax=Zasmidium cellare ATCC 36951 TaxID=1080233 RepID=A0A6A6CY30_ZASCE|nr:uncharacterized protein M409DRAFT_51311 [Zasmidium cellare ATCC 36951]KAF2171090.1 hypothetical protein M409DRAFT_51311 [Zasmidium cellare ATCC 36951]